MATDEDKWHLMWIAEGAHKNAKAAALAHAEGPTYAAERIAAGDQLPATIPSQRHKNLKEALQGRARLRAAFDEWHPGPPNG